MSTYQTDFYVVVENQKALDQLCNYQICGKSFAEWSGLHEIRNKKGVFSFYAYDLEINYDELCELIDQLREINPNCIITGSSITFDIEPAGYQNACYLGERVHHSEVDDPMSECFDGDEEENEEGEEEYFDESTYVPPADELEKWLDWAGISLSSAEIMHKNKLWKKEY